MAILADRLILKPLQMSDAAEMHLVLDDLILHSFTGGKPLTLIELQERYAKLETGSESASETWVNLIVRLRSREVAIGFVQATIHNEDICYADIAWVVGVPWQGQGYASEAAGALVAWLKCQGIDEFRANIHPTHNASIGIAQRLGMHPTAVQIDRETQWKLSATFLR